MLSAFAHPAWSTFSWGSGEVGFAVASASGAVIESTVPGLCLAGDLRLHNREALEEALGLTAHGNSDASLVVEAYRRWGIEFASRLNGDFGLCLWDAVERRLLLLRDSGGACPIFYGVGYARLAFASHPRGLLAVPGISRRLDERAVVDYLGEFPQVEESTLFADVRRLPPGHLLIVTDEADRLVRFFEPAQVAERTRADDEECAEALRSALARAVSSRLPGDRRLAIMLSGGLDSSTMTCLAAHTGAARGLELHTISAIFPDYPESDERGYQATVVRRVRSQHHEVRPTPDSAGGDFDRLCRTFSEPAFIGPHWIAWSACEVAASQGIAAMMTGIDGDRVVSHGAGRFGDLAAARDFGGLFRELSAVQDFGWGRRLRVGVSQILLAELPDGWSRVVDSLDPRFRLRLHERTQLLRGDVLRRHGVAARLREEPRRARSTREEHLRALSAPDRNWDVELLEQLGTTFNIRFEQPFFDRRVVELCVSFPGAQKRQHGWSRYVLRQAMRGCVPGEVLERRADASFDKPYWAWARRWLTHQHRDTSALSNISDYIDVLKVRRRLRALPTESNRGPVDFLWKCVVLSRWLDAVAAVRAG